MIKISSEAKIIYPAFLGAFAFFGVLAYGIWSWRIATFPHAVATITEVWDEQRKVARSGKYSQVIEYLFDLEPRYTIVTVGRITFTRHQNGKPHECERVVDLGVPTDGYAVGQQFDVVPAKGTCQRVDVIKRLP